MQELKGGVNAKFPIGYDVNAQVHQRADVGVSDVAVDPRLIQLAENGARHHGQVFTITLFLVSLFNMTKGESKEI